MLLLHLKQLLITRLVRLEARRLTLGLPLLLFELGLLLFVLSFVQVLEQFLDRKRNNRATRSTHETGFEIVQLTVTVAPGAAAGLHRGVCICSGITSIAIAATTATATVATTVFALHGVHCIHEVTVLERFQSFRQVALLCSVHSSLEEAMGGMWS